MNEFRKYTNDRYLAAGLVIALLLEFLPLGIVSLLSPLFVVGVLVALLLR